MNNRDITNEEILDLEEKTINKFKNPKELLSVARKILKNMTVPVVFGYENNERKNLTIRRIESNDISDGLSVQNYLAGLEELTKNKFSDEDILKVDSFLILKRIEEIKYAPQGQNILLLGIGQGRYSFYLDISYYHAANDRGIKYIAKCQKEISMLEQIMDKYMCPNKNKFNVIV